VEGLETLLVRYGHVRHAPDVLQNGGGVEERRREERRLEEGR
jgi:hypothetical protein